MIDETFLKELRGLFEEWGISPDDWYVTGEVAMGLWGYPITTRGETMDVLLCRNRWPWPRPEEQVSLFPDAGTEAERQLSDLANRFSVHLDIHPMPHVGLSDMDRFAHTDWYPDASGVRVLLPWAGILHRKLIIEFYESGGHEHGLAVFDQKKFLRWKKFVEEVVEFAKTNGDTKVIEVAPTVLASVNRAIAFFDVSLSADVSESEVRGMGVYPGVVSGPVTFWNEAVDPVGKIVLLEQATAAKVTLLRRATGIVTNQGGSLSHAACIAREYQIPAVVGTQRATMVFQEGDRVELNGQSGLVRKIT